MEHASRRRFTPPTYPRMHLLPNGNVFYSAPGHQAQTFNLSTHTWTLTGAGTNFGSDRIYGSSVLLPLTPANNYDPKVMTLGGGGPHHGHHRDHRSSLLQS